MTEKTEIALSLKNISYSYKGSNAPVIKDFSLDVTKGSFTTLLGPSGCGKTTLLRLISGFLVPSSGTIELNGIVYNPSDNLAGRVQDFYKTVSQKALPAVEKDKSLATQAKKDFLLQIFKDSRAWETQTADSLLSNLSYYWTYSTKDYYLTRLENYEQIEKKDIEEYLKKYVYDSNPVVMVYVNPEVYEQNKAEFDEAGFVQITADNAFWWSK